MTLTDTMGKDMNAIWDTFNNVVTLKRDGIQWSCKGHDGTPNFENCAEWANLPREFRWGTLNDQVNNNVNLAGQNVMESGPRGPNDKGALKTLSQFE